MSAPFNKEVEYDELETAKTEIKRLQNRIYDLEKRRDCTDGACMKCHGCYEVMRAEFNDIADRNEELVSAIAYGLRDIWAGKDWTPAKRFEKVLKKIVRSPRRGQFHKRPDGKDCDYMAEVFCNKCGWVDPKLKKDPE